MKPEAAAEATGPAHHDQILVPMTEADWQTGTDGEAMLEWVSERLWPRHWMLLACAWANRLNRLVAVRGLRDALRAAEQAAVPLPEPARSAWLERIDAEVSTVIWTATDAFRPLVARCDLAPAVARPTDAAEPAPSAPAGPLLQAANRYARQALDEITTAAAVAIEAVRNLYELPPGPTLFAEVRADADTARRYRNLARLSARTARRLKRTGDALAARAGRSEDLDQLVSLARDKLRHIEAADRNRRHAPPGPRERADRSWLAGLLREIVGNPFRPPEFAPQWQTEAVQRLARGIDEERAYDRLPVLADALQEAGCDYDPLLRHCRGTEPRTCRRVGHVYGCWAVELVLGRYQPPAPAPAAALPPPRDPYWERDLRGPPAPDTDRFA